MSNGRRGSLYYRTLIFAALFFCAIVPVWLRADAGATSTVSIKAGFDPSEVKIHPGDTVTWTNNDDRDHDVTADDNSFASGNLKAGKSFSHKFPDAGRFPYSCSLHPREHGVVIVEK